MGFFDDFSKKAKEFADVASEKAKDLAGTASEKAKEAADNAKITAAILSEQRELEKGYKAIGEWYVSQLEGDAPEGVADLVAAAKASQEKIAELKESRQKAQPAEPKCPLCGSISEGKFCPHCGTPMPEPCACDEACCEEPKECCEESKECCGGAPCEEPKEE